MNLIFNAFQTLTEFNQTSLSGLFAYPANTWEGFTPLVLTGLCVIVTLATFYSQTRLTGRANFFASLAVGSWFTAIIATIMSMMDMVDPLTLIAVYVISIGSLGLLFLTKERP